MTILRCVCGAVMEGHGDELLDAVERHLAGYHAGATDSLRAAVLEGVEPAPEPFPSDPEGNASEQTMEVRR